jgi:hypothetical protein
MIDVGRIAYPITIICCGIEPTATSAHSAGGQEAAQSPCPLSSVSIPGLLQAYLALGSVPVKQQRCP